VVSEQRGAQTEQTGLKLGLQRDFPQLRRLDQVEEQEYLEIHHLHWNLSR